MRIIEKLKCKYQNVKFNMIYCLSSNFQCPINFQTPSSKSFWILRFYWKLGFGHWDFSAGAKNGDGGNCTPVHKVNKDFSTDVAHLSCWLNQRYDEGKMREILVISDLEKFISHCPKQQAAHVFIITPLLPYEESGRRWVHAIKRELARMPGERR